MRGSRRIWTACCLLLPGLCHAVDPSGQQVFNQVRDNVGKQLAASANYTCMLTVDRVYFHEQHKHKSDCGSEGTRDESRPFMHDRLRLDVAVSEGSEIFSWHGGSKFSSIGIDDVVKSGPVSSGSFVGYVRNIFLSPGIEIHYKGRMNQGSSGPFTFTFTVPRQSSHHQILGQSENFIVPYHGSFSVDENRFELKSLSVIDDDIPNGADVCSASMEVTYQNVDISGKPALIPKLFELRLTDTAEIGTISRSEYSQCHEFRGESTVRFDLVDAQQGQPTPTHREERIPDKVSLHAAITTALDDESTFTGDPVQGRLLSPLRLKSSGVVQESLFPKMLLCTVS